MSSTDDDSFNSGDERNEDTEHRESDEETEDDERENRFRGTSQAWLTYTRDDRGLAASLDQERANNLSLHLYNAHSLKARLRDPELFVRSKAWSSKQDWIRRENDGSLPWLPDRSWTAWPLPPQDVPRKREAFGVLVQYPADDEGTHRRTDPWEPSTDLREDLEALVSRKAKERFQSRKRAECKASSCHSSGSNAAAQPVMDTAHFVQEDSDAKHNVKSETESDNFISSPIDSFLPTAFLADDDKAHTLLQPTIEHVLAQFNDLLLGLHQSRLGHRLNAFAPRSRRTSTNSASGSRSRSKAVDTAKKYERGSKRRRLDSDSLDLDTQSDPDDPGYNSDASDSDKDVNDEGVVSDSKAHKSRSGSSDHPLGLRDWSEVLGIASIVGWDPTVIDRAAKRCVSLFGEGISFRHMPESVVGDVKDRIVNYVPDSIPQSRTDSDTESYGVESTPVTSRAYFCPYQSCPRHYEAFEKPFRWREHMKRSHKLTKDQTEVMETSIRDSRSAFRASQSMTVDQSLDQGEGKVQAIGAVHNDGLLKPITAPTRRKSVKTRGEKVLKTERAERAVRDLGFFGKDEGDEHEDRDSDEERQRDEDEDEEKEGTHDNNDNEDDDIDDDDDDDDEDDDGDGEDSEESDG